MDELIANDPECFVALMQAVPACMPEAMRDSGRWDDEGRGQLRGASGVEASDPHWWLLCSNAAKLHFCLRRIPSIAIMALRGSLAP